MFARIPHIESEVDQHIAAQRYNEALANIMVGVHGHHKQEAFARSTLYYPQFDAQMQTLSEALYVDPATPPVPAVSDSTLLIASEIYQVGGHSRVIADLVREVPQPTLVLTDMYWRFRNTPDHLNWILDAYAWMPVIVLPQRTLWAKCQGLRQLTERLRPKNIFYFNHHEDPIPFVGTLAYPPARKTLFHHCDHNPSLGNTCAGVAHVDFIEEMAQACAHHLHRPADVLPLFVPDRGPKTFAPTAGRPCSAVTCGTHVKYARSGPLALQDIVATVLATLDGQFFHIGALDAQWVADIRAHLSSRGLAPERFVPLGDVASLWDTLQQLDAQVYITSAPIGGGRVAIEAQGCGYPLLFYRTHDQGPAAGSDSLYANKALEWRTVQDLPPLLNQVRAQHATLSQQARDYYLAHFSHQNFARVTERLCHAEPQGVAA